MKDRQPLLLILSACLMLTSCVTQIESTEEYQDPNSFLISMLPDIKNLQENWKIISIASTQFTGDFDDDYTEVAKRYFVAYEKNEIRDNVLLQFELREMPTTPKNSAELPKALPNYYELTEIKTNNELARYQDCGEFNSRNNTNDCLFILIKGSLVYSLEITTKSDDPKIREIIESVTIPLILEMENKLLSLERN